MGLFLVEDFNQIVYVRYKPTCPMRLNPLLFIVTALLEVCYPKAERKKSWQEIFSWLRQLNTTLWQLSDYLF